MIKQLFKNIFILFFIIIPAAGVIAQKAKHHPATGGLKASVQKGETLYKQYCLTCHQADGYGVPNMNPPLIKTKYVTGDKKKLILWVLSGSGTNKLSIDGVTYRNKMPSQKNLKDEEVADILTYVRNSFGNKASMITPAEVKSVRTTIK